MHQVGADEAGEGERARDDLLSSVRETQQQECDERHGDLDADGILRCAEEFPDPQRLLDPAEEQLDLPSLLIEIGDDLGR